MILYKPQLLLLAMTLCIPVVYAQSQCSVTLSRPVVDYGHISQQELHEYRKGWYRLGENSVIASVWCDSPQKIAIFISGKTKGKEFQFGDEGKLLIVASQATLDGHSVQLGKTSGAVPFITQLPGHNQLPVSSGDGLLPIKNEDIPSGQKYSIELKLSPQIDSTQHKTTDNTNYTSDLHIQIATNN
jgi:hypothetical protein